MNRNDFSEGCNKSVAVALRSMHNCSLDAKIRVNLGKSSLSFTPPPWCIVVTFTPIELCSQFLWIFLVFSEAQAVETQTEAKKKPAVEW